MRKITLLLKSFTLLCFLLLLSNCGTNEIEDNSTASAVNEVKNWYRLHKNELNSPIFEYIDALEWENAIISDGADGVVIEVPFTLQSQLQSSNEKASLFNDHHRLMFLKNDQNKFRVFYVQIFTDSKQSNVDNNNFNYYNINENFDGKVFLQDLSNGVNTQLQFKDGNKVLPSQTAKMREEAITCVWIGWWKEDGFHPIQLLYCEGGGPTGEEDIPPSYGGGGGAGSNPGTSTPAKPQIIDNLTGKAKCINNLLNQNGNSFIEKLLSNFEGNAKFNIVIGSADKVFNSDNEEINGKTTYTVGSNDLQILISSSKIESISSLEAARLILHEYIHADMLRKLLTTDINDIEAANFREVYSRYVGEQYHSAMANQYMSSMKEALKDFHKNILREDFDKYVNFYGEEPNDELYEAMAWNGLKEVDVVAWDNLTPEKKASINATFNNVAKKLTQVSLCSK
jgi:hypothetical protein